MSKFASQSGRDRTIVLFLGIFLGNFTGSPPRGRQMCSASLSQRRAPILILLEDFVPGAALAIDHSRAIAVLVSHLVIWNDELPVPSRLGRRWGPSTAWCMRKTES